MKKTLNKFLKFLGFNVVKAKRPRARKLTLAQVDALVAAVPHRKEKNKRILATYTEGRPPYTEAELLNSGMTHFEGDDCPGGHCEVEHGAPAPAILPPNNDNNVTGPTS